MGKETPNNQIEQLKLAALAIEKLKSRCEALERVKSEPIAIIGMGCRLPGRCNNPVEFWKLLRHGINPVSEVPSSRWDPSVFFDRDLNVPGKINSKMGAFLEDVDLFDPEFFGIGENEAISMDPQQRILLEVAWEGPVCVGGGS